MNTTQIHYFVVAATHLNFTKAAKELHISQPALSKQIYALESELNLLLFIRNKKNVILTPAGKMLLRELPSLEAHYTEIIHKAQIINQGMIGELNIAILEGQIIGDLFTKAFTDFVDLYPNISIRLIRNSFSILRKMLIEGTTDIAVSLDFDVRNHPGLITETISPSQAIAVVSKNHSLAHLNMVEWKDIKDETFILVDKNDCPTGASMFISECREHGFNPTVSYAPSLEIAMLRVEAGLGIGIVNTMSTLTNNPFIHVIDTLNLGITSTVLVWKESNPKPLVKVFVDFYLNYLSKRTMT